MKCVGEKQRTARGMVTLLVIAAANTVAIPRARATSAFYPAPLTPSAGPNPTFYSPYYSPYGYYPYYYPFNWDRNQLPMWDDRVFNVGPKLPKKSRTEGGHRWDEEADYTDDQRRDWIRG